MGWQMVVFATLDMSVRFELHQNIRIILVGAKEYLSTQGMMDTASGPSPPIRIYVPSLRRNSA